MMSISLSPDNRSGYQNHSITDDNLISPTNSVVVDRSGVRIEDQGADIVDTELVK